MTCIIVNDASCLIDLKKGRLLAAFVRLPFDLVIPLTVRESELLDFTELEWALMDDAGLTTIDLPADGVRRALQIRQLYRRLSANDAFCLATAEQFDDRVLLTGDRLLKTAAEASAVEVHGVLWVVDELHRLGICGTDDLLIALELWRDDGSVFLPAPEIRKRIERLRE